MLEEIKNLYHEHLKTEVQLAEKYHTSPDNISSVLSELGYSYGLLDIEKGVSIARAWQSEIVKNICNEIARNL